MEQSMASSPWPATAMAGRRMPLAKSARRCFSVDVSKIICCSGVSCWAMSTCPERGQGDPRTRGQGVELAMGKTYKTGSKWIIVVIAMEGDGFLNKTTRWNKLEKKTATRRRFAERSSVWYQCGMVSHATLGIKNQGWPFFGFLNLISASIILLLHCYNVTVTRSPYPLARGG